MTLKVLQWNCLYSEDITAICAYVKKAAPDILFLQELARNYAPNHPDTGKYVAESLGYDSHVAYGPMVLPDGQTAQMGMGIFSKFPLFNKQKIILQPGTVRDGIVIADERFFLDATITLNGQKVGLGTAHLPFHPKFRTTPAKQRMTESILRTANAHQHYLFGGDLNTTPYTKAAVTFRKNGLRNAGPALSRPTWTTKPFAIGPWRYDKLQWRLDYILIRGGLRASSARILHTTLSDHLPILTEITLQSQLGPAPQLASVSN